MELTEEYILPKYLELYDARQEQEAEMEAIKPYLEGMEGIMEEDEMNADGNTRHIHLPGPLKYSLRVRQKNITVPEFVRETTLKGKKIYTVLSFNYFYSLHIRDDVPCLHILDLGQVITAASRLFSNLDDYDRDQVTSFSGKSSLPGRIKANGNLKIPEEHLEAAGITDSAVGILDNRLGFRLYSPETAETYGLSPNGV